MRVTRGMFTSLRGFLGMLLYDHFGECSRTLREIFRKIMGNIQIGSWEY